MADVLELPRAYIDEMIAHAREDVPNECCGVIAGPDGRAEKLFRAVNADASPYNYTVDSRDLLRIHRECEANGWDFVGIYHSHVRSEAYPSPTDVAMAAWRPEPAYIVISLMHAESPDVRAYRIVDGEIDDVELRPVP